MPTLGERIRALRQERKYTLHDVSVGADLTPSFLSRLERDKVNISVANLRKIANYFGVPMTYFFSSEEAPAVEIVRAGARRKLRAEAEKLQVQGLLPEGEFHPDAFEAIVEPGGRSQFQASREGRTLLYVIEGVLTCWVGEEHYQLRAGDTLYIRNGTEYGWENTGLAKTRLLLIQPLGYRAPA
ncbi:MAG: helix-turn-helix transcriptional regulator [Chloroflexia bacterium]|nr:helix-turn-helix transcriptional regulator [Chloroflexia bacterium]